MSETDDWPNDLPPDSPWNVTCARCGHTVSTDHATPEEGDEWECLPCNNAWNLVDELRDAIAKEQQKNSDLERELAEIREWHKKVAAHFDGNGCCCQFDEGGNAPVKSCFYHAEQARELTEARKRIEELRVALTAMPCPFQNENGPCQTINSFTGETLKNPRLCPRCKVLTSD
jgi:hypothetical protein